jgi:deoxyribodipyrimidine photo-lyase
MTFDPDCFEPTDNALRERLAAVDIAAYGRSRNHLQGRVTRLSPYLTHGFTSIPELFGQLPALRLTDKLAFEFGWREFFHHVWSREGDAILSDLRAGLPGVRYANALPGDIREGRTGLAVIDTAVQQLYGTGYLHNHARMWLASYVVHLRKVHWRAGADWMFAHLLDGDLASNHLSWQWVAATFSSKPYLFNAENVARFAPPDWHCAGSAIDTSYEALEDIARNNQTVAVSPSQLGSAEPALLAAPSELPSASMPEAERIRLVHPWMLADQPFDGLRLGVIHLPFHSRFQWSVQRWRFVMDRMSATTDAVFIGDLRELNTMLNEAPHVESIATLNPGYRERLPALCTHLSDAPRRFINPAKTCRSFSAFWAQCGDADALNQRSWHS